MKAKVYRAVCLIVALVVAVFTAGYAFAWFIDRRNSPFEISGASAGAYFDSTSGDGTSADQAFVIANATHMRNLAVLQNTGRFVDAAGNPKTYYFEIKKTVDEIDMGDLWLPPIGNDKDPFIGVFNGNGKTITNLKVTTDKTLLTVDNYPTQASPDYEFSNAVGLFGNTGEASEIRNFILDNPIVLVGSESKTLYGSAGKKVVGIAVGHVAGKCSSIGVRATDDAETSLQIVDANTKYSTFNSILGELGEGVESSVTGGGHTAGTGGSGSAFGASFDVDQLANRLIEINKNKVSPYLPNTDTSSSIPVPAAGYKVAFTVDSGKSSYVGENAREIVSDQNIGYDMGNQNKISSKKINYTDVLMKDSGDGNHQYYLDKKADGSFVYPDNNNVPRWFYVQSGGWQNSGYRGIHGFAPISQEKYDSLPDNVKNLLQEENHSVMRIQAGYTQYSSAPVDSNRLDANSWSYHGQISWMGKIYGEGRADRDGYAVDENGSANRYTAEGYLLDDNGFMFDKNGLFIPNDSGWDKPIYSVDENGNGKNAGGEFYDANALDGTAFEGCTVDENGLLYGGDKGYFINNVWPVQNYTISPDGYIEVDGSEYLEPGTGNRVKAYGYELGEYNETNGYALMKDGQPFTLNMGGWSTPLYARKGTYVKAKAGTPVKLYAYKNGIALPNNGLWFKPSQAGTVRFVMLAQKDSEAFCLLKVTRTNANKNNPFYTTGSDITVEKVMQQQLPPYVLFYYEIDVTQEDIDAGNIEYLIMVDNNVTEETEDGGTTTTSYKGAYFVYLDIGASAAEDTSAVNPDVQVSAVDFIYDKVEISQADVTGTDIKLGDFIVTTSGSAARYDSSKTSVYFEELTTVLKIVYVRLHNDTAGNHSGKTICLEGSTPTLNTNSEVKATYATYVCPTISGGSGTVSGGGGGGGGTEEPDPTVEVSSVTISSSADSVTMGNTLSLSASVLPEDATDKTVTWTVTDGTGSATISSGGVLTPVSPGTVTVTATAGGKSATKTITVNAANQPATTATVNIDDYNTLSGKTLAISAKADGVEYFKITSTLGYKYVSNNDAVGGPVIISSNNNRPMTVEIGSGVAADKSVEITLKIAIAQKEALQLGSTATFTSSGTATVELGGVQVTSVTTTDNNTVVELKITLKGSDASLRIDCENRIALVSASAIIK